MKCDFVLNSEYTKFINQGIRNGLVFFDKNYGLIYKELPENEKSKSDFNQLFDSKGETYKVAHPYYNAAVDLINRHCKNPHNILEVGAGYGLFAEVLVTIKKPDSYTCYDFSDVIDNLDTSNYDNFIVKKENLFNIDNHADYDCVIALNVLDHMRKDVEFIQKLKLGTFVFFSLFNRYVDDCVRSFLLPEDIQNRYQDSLDIKEIKCIRQKKGNGIWWVVAAERRDIEEPEEQEKAE